MLDLVEIPLRQSGLRFVRLDGSMTQSQRDQAIRAFNSDPVHRLVRVMCLLLLLLFYQLYF
jgi:SNF2 family DNA or RNA helicase